VQHLHYCLVLLFILTCGVGVNLAFRVHMLRYWKNFIFVDSIILVIYLLWDTWAIYKTNWYFDSKQILSQLVILKVPIEEILFFIVVPFTSIVTYLSLQRISGWGDSRK
jgi:lycopene cyclase domain-containing protein